MDILSIWRDLRFAGRTLAKQRSFSLVSIGILALGIAGTATVFSLFNGLYLRPFPVPNPDRLMDLNETAPKWGLDYTGIAHPDFHAWREHNQSFESMYAWTLWGANLSVDGKAKRVNVLVATHEYFDVLGIQPVLGRRFTPEADQPNGPKVVLLSYGLWQQMSGRNPAVLGQTLQLDGDAFTIVGVLPPQAGFPVDVDVLRPLAADPLQGKDSWYLSGIGRMRKGVTVEQARDDLTRIHRGLAEQQAANLITSPTVKTLRQRYLGEYWQGVTILLGAVGLVLLIACCNVASIRLLSGRLFGEPDNRPDSEKTAIVNESFAKYYWPGQDAIDKRLRFRGSPDWIRVIGVTADVKHYGLEQPMRPSVCVPYSHAASTTMFGVVRTRGDPLSLARAVRESVRSADPDLPVHDIKTMSDRVHASMLFRLTYSSMFIVYGAIAALMAFAGIYGVASYWAGQRTQEIGIRMALGAKASDVVKMVIREGLRLVGAGLVIGLIAALGLSRLLAGTLYHVSPTDLTTFVTTTLVLVAAASVACYLPARRAARIDPMVALRCE